MAKASNRTGVHNVHSHACKQEVRTKLFDLVSVLLSAAVSLGWRGMPEGTA